MKKVKIRLIRQHSYVPMSRKSWQCRTCLQLPGTSFLHKSPSCPVPR